LEGTFKGHLAQPPCKEQGHYQLILWLFLSFCDITGVAVLKLYFSNSDLSTSCVLGGKKYKRLEAENIYLLIVGFTFCFL